MVPAEWTHYLQLLVPLGGLLLTDLCLLLPLLEPCRQVMVHGQGKVYVHRGAPRQRSRLATAAQ